MGVIILFSQTQCPNLSHYKRRYHLSQCITCISFEISHSLFVFFGGGCGMWTCSHHLWLSPSLLFFPILPSPASTHPLLPSLPPKIALGLAHGQPNARICRYMTWMLLRQWLKRHVCQQAAHTYSCIVLSRPSLTLFFSSSFVWLGFCLRTIVRPCLFTWLFGHLCSGELCVCFGEEISSVSLHLLPPPEKKTLSLWLNVFSLKVFDVRAR